MSPGCVVIILFYFVQSPIIEQSPAVWCELENVKAPLFSNLRAMAFLSRNEKGDLFCQPIGYKFTAGSLFICLLSHLQDRT